MAGGLEKLRRGPRSALVAPISRVVTFLSPLHTLIERVRAVHFVRKDRCCAPAIAEEV